MKRKNSWRDSCILLIILLYTACGMPDRTFPLQEINKDLKQKFAFQKGSYWIYKNTTTGKYDTGYVNAKPFLRRDDQYTVNRREYMEVYTAFHGVTGTSADTAFLTYYIEGSISYSTISGVYSNISAGKSFQAIWDLYPFSKNIRPDSTTYQEFFYPSIEINGNTYINVTQVINHAIGIPATDSSICFYNDSVGLIKMDITYGSFRKSLELEQWNLIKK